MNKPIEFIEALAGLGIILVVLMFGGVLLSMTAIVLTFLFGLAVVSLTWESICKGVSSLFSRSETTREREEDDG
jgi:hypothetical protein